MDFSTLMEETTKRYNQLAAELQDLEKTSDQIYERRARIEENLSYLKGKIDMISELSHQQDMEKIKSSKGKNAPD